MDKTLEHQSKFVGLSPTPAISLKGIAISQLKRIYSRYNQIECQTIKIRTTNIGYQAGKQSPNISWKESLFFLLLYLKQASPI